MPTYAHTATAAQTVLLRQEPQDVLYHAVQRECMVLSFALLLLLLHCVAAAADQRWLPIHHNCSCKVLNGNISKSGAVQQEQLAV
jgi:hypothetical protein